MNIYERIKTLCKQQNLTVTSLEKELGFAKGSLSKIDSHKPSSERIHKLADRLGVSASYILTGETDSYYTNKETARYAQEIFENPDLRALFDAGFDSTPEDLKMATDLLKRLKGTNSDE